MDSSASSGAKSHLVVDRDAIVVAAELSADSSDARLLAPMSQAASSELARIGVRAEGSTGLADRSSARHSVPRRTPPERVRATLGLRATGMTAVQISGRRMAAPSSLPRLLGLSNRLPGTHRGGFPCFASLGRSTVVTRALATLLLHESRGRALTRAAATRSIQ